MATKKLICKYLAALWLISLLGFLGLESHPGLAKQKQAKNPDVQELVLVTAQQGQASDFAPGLKLLPAFLLPDASDFCPSVQLGISPGPAIHSLLKTELFQFIKSSISINAP